MLPLLPQPPGHDLPAGPTPWSNWVIPGRVLAGAFPASLDDGETEQLLTLLLELGVNTFVCLQAEVNIHIPDHTWRAGLGLRPYIRDAQRLLSRAQAAGPGGSRIQQRRVDFLHLPIIDGSVTSDSAMSRLADDCCGRVLAGELLYIHCWGGHGRTGTLVAVMLGRLYGLPYSLALRHTQAAHDSRVFPQGVRSPQTAVQRAQVKRLLLLPNPFAALAAEAARQACTAAATAATPHRHQLAAGSTARIGSSGGGGSAGGAAAAAAAAAAGLIASPSKAGVVWQLGPSTPIKQAPVVASLGRSNVTHNTWPPVTPPAAATPSGAVAAGCSSSSSPSSSSSNSNSASLVRRMQQLALNSGPGTLGAKPSPVGSSTSTAAAAAAAMAAAAAATAAGGQQLRQNITAPLAGAGSKAGSLHAPVGLSHFSSSSGSSGGSYGSGASSPTSHSSRSSHVAAGSGGAVRAPAAAAFHAADGHIHMCTAAAPTALTAAPARQPYCRGAHAGRDGPARLAALGVVARDG